MDAQGLAGRRFAYLLLTLALLSPLSAAAQKPRLVFDADGPVNVIRSIAFSPDSSRVYAAGMDKVVHTWEIRQFGEKLIRYDANHVQSLRWDVSRGLRGAIYSIATPRNPESPLLALAGYSANDAAGDIVLYDVKRSEMAAEFHRDPEHPDETVGHLATISSLAFSPGGERLATISKDGDLRSWAQGERGWGQLAQLVKPHGGPEIEHSVTFVDAGKHDVAASFVSRGQGYLVMFDTTRKAPPRALAAFHSGEIRSLAAKPGENVLATADTEGDIVIWREGRPAALRRGGDIATDLAFGPGNWLFAATKMSERGPARLELWDIATGELVDARTTAFTVDNFSCEVSPNGQWVATGGGDQSEVLLFLLKRPDGDFRAKPLSEPTLLRLIGRGEKVGKVAFAKDGSYRVGFGRLTEPKRFNEYGDIQQVFDFQDPALAPIKEGDDFHAVADNARGWRVAIDESGFNVNLLFGDRGIMGRIHLDRIKQGRIQSYCFLADRTRAFAIAVATDLQNGIFVYGLVGADGPCPLLRYYRDHTAHVTSLSVSSDGRYLASGAADQTIKLWSLAGIRTFDELRAAQGGPFPPAPAWGAVFEMQPNGKGGRQVVLSSLLGGSIAEGRGLQKDDVIQWVQFFDPEKKAVSVVGEPARVLDVLTNTRVYDTLVLWVQRGGVVQPRILLVPAWEPLMTLFVDRRGEWALSTPQGPYDASVSGDELFGWQINRGLNVKPDFFVAEQFRGEFEKPEVLREILRTGSLSAALEKLALNIPDVPRVAENAPVIEILQPAEGASDFAAGEPIKLRALVQYPDDKAASKSVRAFVNGVPARDPVIAKDGLAHTYTWQVQPAEAYCSAVIVADGAGPTSQDLFGRQRVTFRMPNVAVEPKLHILALAAGKAYHEDVKLRFPVADAEAVIDLLQKSAAPLYDAGNVYSLFEEKLTKASVNAQIDEIRNDLNDASSGDLLVIFIAGHGVGLDREYYFVPPHPKVRGLETAADQELVRQVGVGWNELRRLSDVPCRKLVMLDTCFAGNLLLKQHVPDHLKAAVRPLKHDEMLVLSATDVGELAAEFPALGHGIFTDVLLKGLGGEADRPHLLDGEVDFEEIVGYVSQEVPKQNRDRSQHPVASPHDLLRAMVFMPLVRYRQAEAE